jgi:exo beta-1,2-glucooligosaccharide sophorohydrolase (non-reducing end)
MVGLLCSIQQLFSQSYPFFQDSENQEYYEYCWMEVTPPSELNRAGTDLRRFPVETTIPPIQGINCLNLHWKSVTEGNWLAIAAGENWTPKNIRYCDTLAFWMYSIESIDSLYLPSIFFEDTNNQKSSFINIGSFSTRLQIAVWKRITIPMKIFFTSEKQIDWTSIKTIGFSQNLADNQYHTLLIDDMRVNKGAGETVPFNKPTGLKVKGYDSHAWLTWNTNSEPNGKGYEIYLSVDSGKTYELRDITDYQTTIFNDFTRDKGTNLSLKYKITALNESNEPSQFSDVADASTHDFNNDELLTMVQEATFRYFWDFAHPTCGLARERDTSGDIVTLGGSGFGIMALMVGIERGFITRSQGAERMLKIVNFLKSADRFHGAWPHWMNGKTGKVVPFSTKDDGGDLLESALMIQGLLAARHYFNNADDSEKQIVSTITNLWESVEWDWFRKNNGPVLYWHWSPDYDWQMNMPIRGWNEGMIVYLLAIASPTHGLPASLWNSGWTNSSNYLNGKTFYDYKIDVGWDYGGPLFFTQYSFIGFDPRNRMDSFTNYFENNKNITLVNRAYCIQNPKGFKGYGENCWGLSASDDPVVYYLAHQPASANDNGTITPTAAISAMVYTPDYSIEALKYFYRNLGNKLWNEYGFYDAFNQQLNWYATSSLAIDEGPIIAMIENYRTGLIWKNFMQNQEIKTALDAIGFTSTESVTNELSEKTNLSVVPNPVTTSGTIRVNLSEPMEVSLLLYNVSGQIMETLIDHQMMIDRHVSLNFDTSLLPAGLYILKLKGNNINQIQKLIINH